MVDDTPAESERRYQQLISTSPAPINLFDASGEIVWGNDAVVDLLGLDSRAQLVGRSIFEFIHVDDRYTAKRELAEVVESKTATGPTRMRLSRDDGDKRTIRVATAPGRYGGRDIGQAVIIDVTKFEEIKADLRAERQFIEEALNALEDVFYVVTPGGQLVRWNDALLEKSGYEASEVREMDVEDFFRDADAERVSESIATALAEGADVLEATVVTKCGEEVPYEFRKRRLQRDETVIGLVGIGRDISRRQARDQHLRAVDRLLQHNLRNQLNIVLGRAETIQEAGDGTSAEHTEQIRTAAERMLSIFDNHHYIVDILTDGVEPSSIEVVAELESVVRRFRKSYPNATINVDAPDSAVASAIPPLREAVAEMIKNAIIHNDTDQPTVDVVVEVDESTVVIEVRDHGPEIPEIEYRPMLAEGDADPVFHSTGLGLWFVHWVVQRSRGALRFERNEPSGNVVSIALRRPQNRWHPGGSTRER